VSTEGKYIALDILTFLTVICHQPYAEARKIPLRIALGMERRVGHWVESFFGKISAKRPTAENIIEGLKPPEHWVKEPKEKKKL
jgi:hypothetical protein